MNDEIKEILDRLERIDHKEYSCGFEFADSGSFDEDCRCFEERKKMADYITNLQQENQEMKTNTIPTLKHNIDALVDEVDELEDYKSRIEKAIEIIKNYIHEWYDCIDGETEGKLFNDLLNILQNGSDASVKD